MRAKFETHSGATVERSLTQLATRRSLIHQILRERRERVMAREDVPLRSERSLSLLTPRAA